MTIGWRYRWIDVIVIGLGVELYFIMIHIRCFYMVALWSSLHLAMVYFRIQAIGISVASASVVDAIEN